jgi:hypothetical protein
MTANLFKTKYLPNPDSTDSTTELTNTNTAFVHTYQGDDLTGDGTREHPYRSVYKANQKTGITYIVFRGVINEYFDTYHTGKQIIGDDINQVLVRNNYLPVVYLIYKLTIDTLSIGLNGELYAYCCIILSDTNAGYDIIPRSFGYSLFKKSLSIDSFYFTNTTTLQHSFIGGLHVSCSVDRNNIFKNCLVYRYINVYQYCIFKYIVFFKNTVLKYNGVNIIIPNWSNDSKANMVLLRNAYVSAGMSSDLALYIFTQDTFGNETCKVINETRTGGTAPNIFNRYADNLTGTLSAAITTGTASTSITLTVADSSKFATTGDIFIPNSDGSGSEVFTYTSVTVNSATSITFTGTSYTFKAAHAAACTCTRYGDVLDYNLNPDPLNEALYASDTGGYVGCFKPATPVSNVASNSFASPINVNADGTDNATAGTLLVKNADDSLTFSTTSSQTWNRLKAATTITIPTGQEFNGLGCMSQDGSPFGYYFGKYQNLINPTAITPSGTLEAGTWYKVYNTNHNTYYAILYNGNQYLPDYFFYTGTGSTGFSLLNADSGTVVKKVLASPMESLEILPYDDPNTASTSLPKFSAPMMGDCKMLMYKAGNSYGKAAGTPVLFGDTQVASITDKISYYLGTTMSTGWAVTNADQEFLTLMADTTNYYYDYPVLKYLRLSVNAHFCADYDQ